MQGPSENQDTKTMQANEELIPLESDQSTTPQSVFVFFRGPPPIPRWGGRSKDATSSKGHRY